MLGRALAPLLRAFFVMYSHVGMFEYMSWDVCDTAVFVVSSGCCVWGGWVLWGRGIYQRPSALLRVPCIIGVPFFVTVI